MSMFIGFFATICSIAQILSSLLCSLYISFFCAFELLGNYVARKTVALCIANLALFALHQQGKLLSVPKENTEARGKFLCVRGKMRIGDNHRDLSLVLRRTAVYLLNGRDTEIFRIVLALKRPYPAALLCGYVNAEIAAAPGNPDRLVAILAEKLCNVALEAPAVHLVDRAHSTAEKTKRKPDYPKNKSKNKNEAPFYYEEYRLRYPDKYPLENPHIHSHKIYAVSKPYVYIIPN